jgi:1-acyl-sn-glycerol-3-phosphate acyltransferase
MGESITARERGRLLYAIARGLMVILRLLVCRCRVYGLEQVPPSGPLLIVANHLSWYDPLLLGSILRRRLWFFTKEEVFRWSIVGWLVRHTGQIPVSRGERDRVALEQAVASLRAGRALVIFPEGTVARQERMIVAHTGVAMIALHTGAVVLPVAHSGTRRVLRGHWLPRVNVWIGKPYIPTLPEGMARKAGLRAVTDRIMKRVAALLPPEERGVYQ